MYYDFSAHKPKPKPKPKEPPLDKKGKTIVLASLAVLIVTALGAFGITALIQHLRPAPEPEPEPEETATRITDDLNYAFLALEPSKQNLIYSPLSIKNGLSLLNLGAAGDTRTQITDVLGESLMLNTQDISDKVSLANAVFIRDTFKDSVLRSYINEALRSSSAEIIYDDFTSTSKMDTWVSNKTFKLIDTLGVKLDADTRMVLINALAIKLNWLHQFDTRDTSSHPFTSTDGKIIDATTMSMVTKDDDVSYFQDDDLSIVSLPLHPAGDVSLNFIAIMPRTTSLDDYLNTLNLDQFTTKLSTLTPASTLADGVELYIPKFKFSYELKFKADLEKLGLTDIFTPEADFSNMATQPLYVSDAIHKANIDFSEDGIKAAAVTAAVMTVGSTMINSQPEPLTINFDRPFLFLIRDQSNGTIWFTGTIYQPNLWSDDASLYQM